MLIDLSVRLPSGNVPQHEEYFSHLLNESQSNLTISLAYMSHSRSSDFGSLDNMKNQLAAASVGVQGSGWGWLGYNKQMKKLQIATCVNQDPLQATTGTF